MMTKQVVLTSETHSNQLVTTFSDLFKHNALTDVTIVCQDKAKIEAHRIVLCAGSSLFKEFFINNTQTHPILYLKGIKQQELMPLMEFMYFGETTIVQDNINDFLSVARDLEVSGLEETIDQDDRVKEEIDVLKTKAQSHKIDSKKTTSYSCSQCNFSGKTKESREKHIERDHSHTVTIDDDSKHTVIKTNENNFLPFEELRKHAQLKTAHQAQQNNRDLKHVCDQCNFKTFKISALNIHKLLKHANKYKIVA